MRRTVLTITATILGLVLLLHFKTHPLGGNGGLASLGTVATAPSPTTTATRSRHRQRGRHFSVSSSSGTAAPSASPTPTSVSATRATKTPSAPKTITATGHTIQTRYGPVQVRITERGGRLVNVVAVQLPGADQHSQQIAAYAAPILQSEALKADSARIDVVSGATYTSDGYAQSLQSALDNA